MFSHEDPFFEVFKCTCHKKKSLSVSSVKKTQAGLNFTEMENYDVGKFSQYLINYCTEFLLELMNHRK